MPAPICPYCKQQTTLVDSATIYGKSFGMVYLCRPCDAYVGTHKTSKDHKPLGVPANKELRNIRRMLHMAFDPLWKGKMRRDGCTQTQARQAAYRWLANKMNLDLKDCHISHFDKDKALKAWGIIKQVYS